MLQSDAGQLTRLAIIGYGLIGQRHAEAIKAAPRVELTAIVELEGSASRTVVDQSVAIFADVSRMLQEAKPDGVIIASPTRLHISHARSCVQAGVPT
ncbi:MAG: Gfo/Idh/MocA family protein, partial [Litorivicinaceae bacterium]